MEVEKNVVIQVLSDVTVFFTSIICVLFENCSNYHNTFMK